MLSCKPNLRGSEFIREEAITDNTYSASGNQSSRMNSVPQESAQLKTSAALNVLSRHLP